jgi:hypothetical protein
MMKHIIKAIEEATGQPIPPAPTEIEIVEPTTLPLLVTSHGAMPVAQPSRANYHNPHVMPTCLAFRSRRSLQDKLSQPALSACNADTFAGSCDIFRQ